MNTRRRETRERDGGYRPDVPVSVVANKLKHRSITRSAPGTSTSPIRSLVNADHGQCGLRQADTFEGKYICM